MNNNCNVDKLNMELKALEILEELRDDLEDGVLHSKLGNLITEQRAECDKIAGECGNIDLEDILEEDVFPSGESFDPELMADLAVAGSTVDEEL